jgi:adenosine deaminase
LFGSRLNAQYDTARQVHGLSDVELAELARGSVRGSRAPSPQGNQMLADIDNWLMG